MATELGYYRYPTVFGDRIVFVSEDDLWTVGIEGGTARRLTANPGIPSFPVFSPDGRLIAFTGRDDGPGEVYVMEADGDIPRRLTWMGARTQVVGWSRDGTHVLAATDWRQPFEGVMHLVSVPLDGHPPTTLPYGPARAVSFSPDSDGCVIGRNSGDPARWKRYRGGTAGTIWIDRSGQHRFQSLVLLTGNLANPMWIGRRIYFLSDHEGHGNLYSCTPTGRSLTRHTDHDDYYVRFPSTDGAHIVYHGGADLYCFDIAENRTRKVEVRLQSTRSRLNRRFVRPEPYLETFDLHPQGHSLASVHRGGLFTMGLWEGAPLRHGTVSGVRYRLASWLEDGERIVCVTDEGGEESLLIVSVDGKAAPRPITGDFGRPIELSVCPPEVETPPKGGRGKKKRTGRSRGRKRSSRIALTNHRHELVLVDLASGRSRVLDRSAYGRIQGLAWSPDGRWIAYGHSSSARTSAIRLLEVDSGKIVTATREDFFDGYPSFDPEGQYLYFISWRTYNPVYDSLYFDLGFPKGARPYLITLDRAAVSPFESATRSPRAPGSHEEQDEEGEPHPLQARMRIDVEGIQERIVAFPVPEGRYGRILGAEGRALFSAYPVTGSLGDGSEAEAGAEGVLDAWDFRENKAGRVADRVTDFCLSMDGRVLGVRSGNRVRALPVKHKDDPDKNSDECSRETGWIDLDRIPVAVVPAAEWKQMYREAWRLQRDHFWRPDMAGVDWNEVFERYLPLVERVSTRTEFSDFMWEMQGELGTSHCYEMGGDYLPRPDWRQGFLGADLAYHARSKRWRVERVPKGDSWNRSVCSPLGAPGVDIGPGDELISVDGTDVDDRVSPYEKLVNMASRDIQLRIRRKGRRSVETVVVRVLQDETPLRYRDWVEGNRLRVHDRTRGRVGYVHIPDMGPAGYAEFHRYYNPESVRDGLIIDVRYNRGGHVSQLLLEKLVRKRIGYDVSRWSEPVPYPEAAPMGPMVALTNEYAGSDGDIFCHAFKLFDLGPLIGKRTWGGVIGIWPRASLVDGTVTTQPEFASWFEDVEYGVENYGTDPDIEIDNLPHDYASGRDRQLEHGLSVIRGLLARERRKRPAPRREPGRRAGAKGRRRKR